MKIRAKSIFVVFLLSFIVSAYDCLATDFKYVKTNDAVTDDFEKYKINNDYNYFFGGSDVCPTIIFALKKNYILEGEDDLWKKLDTTPNNMAYVISSMKNRGIMTCGERPQGFDIVDEKGNKIGVWYSILAFVGAPIQIKKDNKINIYPPRDDDNLKTYEQRKTYGR